MKQFTDEEKEMIGFLGVEAFKFLLSVFKATKAKGQDLNTLLEKASDMNELDLDELGA